jgi:hypothetical protein
MVEYRIDASCQGIVMTSLAMVMYSDVMLRLAKAKHR